MSDGSTLTTDELAVLIEDLLAHPESWRDRVELDPHERCCVPITQTDDVEIWLIGWMDGHDTGFHDHDDAAAAIAVVEGSLVDERLAIGSEPIARRFSAGDRYTVAPAAIHRVRHTGGAPAVTLHAYSPPLSRMGTYEVSEDGSLLRHSRDGEERLEATAA